MDGRDEIAVLARTDASGDEVYRRVEAISKTSADALLVDGVDSVEMLIRIRGCTDKPLLFNQISGGKSPRLSSKELRELGVRVVQYSTPMLFAAQKAMTHALTALPESDGLLPAYPEEGDVGVRECTTLLQRNVRSVRKTNLVPGR